VRPARGSVFVLARDRFSGGPRGQSQGGRHEELHALIRRRLRDAYGESIHSTYDVVDEPASVADAKVLAESDPYQFQWWALDQVHAPYAVGVPGLARAKSRNGRGRPRE
jgi:hypothetical protein